MTTVSAQFNRDANHIPIDGLGFTETKAITYVAGTTGALGATTLFTVTGTVAIRMFAVCSTLLDQTGATATLEVGIVGNTAAIIAQSNATTIDEGEIWYGTNPPTVGVLPGQLILAGTNIVQTIAGNTVKEGVLTYYCLWYPISSNGNVVAA
jgi:hypothetical protein